MKIIILSAVGIISALLLLTFCSRELSSTSPEIIPQGRLIIDTHPHGAQIFFENENTGKYTPDSITHLAEGTYEVMLRLDLYLDTLISVNIIEDQPEEIYLDYFQSSRNYAKIYCLSDPENALIHLNDSSTGLYTPEVIEFIWPGNYEVKFTYPEHRSDSLNIVLFAGRTDTISMALQDTSVWVNYNGQNSSLPTAVLMYLLEIDHNRIKWIGTRDKGILRFDGRNWEIYNMINSPLPFFRINSISIDNLNRKWIGTQEGLAIFDDVSWTIYNTSNSGLPNNYINDVAFDSNGDAWIGASSPIGGTYLVKFDGINWDVMDIDEIISTIEIDDNDNLWIGTYEGLMIWDGNEWTDYRGQNPYFYMRGIETIAVENNNMIWIGAWPTTLPQTPGGLFYYDGSEIKPHTTTSRYISDIFVAANGCKWIATGGRYTPQFINPRGGIIKIDIDGNLTLYDTNNSGLHDNLVIEIAVESNGDVWATTRNAGLIKFKGGNL